MTFIRVTLALTAISVMGATASHAALKTRTKSNQCNERESSCPSISERSQTMTLLWGPEQTTEVSVVSATATTGSGTEWSLGASNPSSTSAAKTSYSDLSVTKRYPGPGVMELSFGGTSGSTCPVSVDANKPIKGIGIVVKKNPGGSSERTTFTDVSISRCDASGMTFAYSSVSTYDLAASKK